MPLSETAIKNAKPKGKQYKLTDGYGMFLLIHPNGGKYWRLKYRFNGKEKLLALGVYPAVGLKAARQKRDKYRELIAADIDPSTHRKAEKAMRIEHAETTFEFVAREWIARKAVNLVPSYGDKIVRRLERDVFPWLGKRPIAEITAPELLKPLRRIEERGAIETAHRALECCGQIFRYAIATGRNVQDISTSLRGALATAVPKHFAAITDPEALGGLLRAIDDYKGSLVTKCALRFTPLVFVRPGELRHAEWSEFDFKNALWTIPGIRTKLKKQDHLVPLSKQAIEILHELKPLTEKSKFVFPSERTQMRPMSDNTILAALRRMGFSKDEATGHGFRATARTILDEVLGVRPDYIEHQLAHAVRDPNGRAYNRTAHLPARREMMQLWADYLDSIKKS